MQVAYDVQAWMEKSWPLPSLNSNLNLSVRDLLVSILILVVAYVLKRKGLLVLAIPIFAFEPAILAFPCNVVQSLILRTPRFWDPLSVEPKLQWLLDRFPDLQRETRQIVDQTSMPFFADVSKHQRRIANEQPWRVFPFFAYGTVNHENCAKAPILSSLVMQIPSVRLAMLSMMEEGTEIPIHCGFFKSVLRVHLTLLTDEPDPHGKRFIEVGGERHSWKEGELVAFDDTYPHRVSNHVKGRRVVLFLDVERPYQTQVGSWLGRAILELMRASPSVRAHAALQEKPKTVS
jgi:beta-hydroxylase